MLDIGVLRPAESESSPPPYGEFEGAALPLARKAASGPGRRDEAVDVAVAPEMEVEVADVLFEPIESERGMRGLAEEVGMRPSLLPPLLPTLLSVFELALLAGPACEGPLPGATTEGLCIGDTALPLPSETAR